MNHESAGGSARSSPRRSKLKCAAAEALGLEQGSARALLAKACVQSCTCLPIRGQQARTPPATPQCTHNPPLATFWHDGRSYTVFCGQMQFSSAYSRSQPGATWMHEPAVEPQLICCYHSYSLRPAQDAGKMSLSPPAPGTRSYGTQSSGGTAPQAPRQQHQQADSDARKLTQTLSPDCHAAHLRKGQNPLCHYPHAAPEYLAVASAYQRLLRLHGLETKRLLLPWLLPLLLLLLQLKEDEH